MMRRPSNAAVNSISHGSLNRDLDHGGVGVDDIPGRFSKSEDWLDASPATHVVACSLDPPDGHACILDRIV